GIGGSRLLDDHHVGDQHAARDPAQQACAQGDDDRETIDQFQHQGTAPDDARDTEQQPANHIPDLVVGNGVLGSTRNGDHIVQAHHEIGDDDGAHSRPDRICAPDLMMLVIGQHELYTDPQQKQRTHDFQVGNGQQRQGKGDQDHPQDNGTGGSPQDALHAALVIQLAAGQGDHHRIVTAQQNVDEDNLEHSAPMHMLQNFYDCFHVSPGP